MREILTLGRYFKKVFGQRVRKIPVSLQGFTCPNIDGRVARGGCIYCCNESFSPSLIKINPLATRIKMHTDLKENPILDMQVKQLKEQFIWHSDFHKEKFEIQKYMIYLQSYSNTYAPFATLKTLFDEALALPNVVGMSIGTRIDCVSEDILDLLEGYVRAGKEIWLEYGIQSVFPKTLELINRGHGIDGAQDLFAKTRKRGIKVCAHLIYGLPQESEEMMLESLRAVVGWGVDGLKLHPLYVVRNTALAKMFKNGEYTPISLESYANLIVRSLQEIPQDVVMHRMSSGAHDEMLLAPKWCFDKNIQMRYIRERLREVGLEY
ncbi:TIGR01212 family radical SAM protein [Helicobacter enhydrae]|uniref:TIGR01212 family radical SAM protein n=1 Tax=Helicobacter enhydrae TaxID=222136 RepID=A0A1B1U5P3_9HELI|nr:TIGR01212 family radical SAM protein [Helicobacter enhydrae]ANV98076.1 TIGR01212 family radical SAM protein [Helicobacter enhydrae]